jgi:hypothetical protein
LLCVLQDLLSLDRRRRGGAGAAQQQQEQQQQRQGATEHDMRAAVMLRGMVALGMESTGEALQVCIAVAFPASVPPSYASHGTFVLASVRLDFNAKQATGRGAWHQLQQGLNFVHFLSYAC